MKRCVACALVAVFVLAGCSTIKSFGQDTSKTSVQISNTSQKLHQNQ